MGEGGEILHCALFVLSKQLIGERLLDRHLQHPAGGVSKSAPDDWLFRVEDCAIACFEYLILAGCCELQAAFEHSQKALSWRRSRSRLKERREEGQELWRSCGFGRLVHADECRYWFVPSSVLGDMRLARDR